MPGVSHSRVANTLIRAYLAPDQWKLISNSHANVSHQSSFGKRKIAKKTRLSSDKMMDPWSVTGKELAVIICGLRAVQVRDPGIYDMKLHDQGATIHCD